MQSIIDIIGLTLQTAFIKNEKNGASLLLLSKPEMAKTSGIFKFMNLDFCSYYDEITQKKLIDEFLPLVKADQKRTLLIPDLVNCIEKQKSTRQQFLNIIKSGIDDTGIVQISTYHKQLQYHNLAEGLKFNLITGTTRGSFHDVTSYKPLEYEMKDTGLLSRMVPFSYDYPINIIKKILEYIEEGLTVDGVIFPKIIKKRIAIPNDKSLFRNFEILSTKLGERYGGFGARAQTNFQRLAKANALLEKRTLVSEVDIEKVMQLSRWINYDFNPI